MNDNKTIFSKLKDETKALIKSIMPEIEAIKMAATPPVATPDSGDASAVNDGKLQDGTAIKYTGNATIDVGSTVTLVTDQGEVPAPDGEIVMEDGTTLTISGGKVSEIETAAAASTEAPEAMNAEVNKVSERVTKIVEKFEALETSYNKTKIELDNLKLKYAKLAKIQADTFTVVAEFASMETEEPIEKPVVTGKKQIDRVNRLLNNLNTK